MADVAAVTLQLPLLTVRAAVSLSTVNADTRTVDVTFTTGSKVRRGGLFTDPFVEELSLAAGHVKLDRLKSGRAPVLAAHSADTLDDVIGVVESASLSANGRHGDDCASPKTTSMRIAPGGRSSKASSATSRSAMSCIGLRNAGPKRSPRCRSAAPSTGNPTKFPSCRWAPIPAP